MSDCETCERSLMCNAGKASAAHPHGEFDASQEYKVRAIIDERRTHYLIQWEDDEVTGERYDDTWEPKDYVNRLAVEEWQATKKQRSVYGPCLLANVMLTCHRCRSTRCREEEEYYSSTQRQASQECSGKFAAADCAEPGHERFLARGGTAPD